MKILYLVPNISNEGGVARVLSVKINYFIEKLGFEIHILTQNKGNFPLFYEFNSKIKLHDISLKGNKFSFFFQYKKTLQKAVNTINPDVIIVCDNGLKAFTIPFFLKSDKPIIFESHGSKFIQEFEIKNNVFSKLKLYLLLKFKEIGARKFTKVVALSDENLKEWNVKKGIVIANPIWFETKELAKLENKKAIVLARHSYEKGLDRLLPIWQKVLKKYPDWILEIYGKSDKNLTLQNLALSLKIDKNIRFFEPVKSIDKKYLGTSFFLMTSRSEGFGMALVEAMALGLPCVAYDCPVGPRSIIFNNENGFLVEDGNSDLFVEKINLLIENKDLRLDIGKKAKNSCEKYNLEAIMLQWKMLFEEVVKK